MEKKGESESTTSFLTALSTWHKEELDEKLANKVQVSQRAVGKIIQVFDHLLQRNEKISKALRGEKESEPTENDVDVAPEADSQTGEDKDNVPSLDDAVKELNGKLTDENQKLHQVNTSLHEQNHFLQLKNAEFTENLTAEITKCEELENKFDDVSYELNKFRNRNEKLETLLVETQSELQVGVICKHLIQSLLTSYKITSPLHFTGLHGSRWRQGVQENRALLGVEQMDAEELLAQKKLSNEAIQLEDLLAEV